jgi:hypothetical protein
MYPNLEYLSGNKNIKYPFKENVILSPYLLKDFLIDICIVTKYWNEDFYISELTYKQNDFSIVFNETFLLTIGSGDIHVYDASDCIIKALTFNKDLNIPFGKYSISKENSLIEACCVSSIGKSVNSILVNDSILYNEIKFKKGYNVNIEKQEKGFEISAVRGTGLGISPCNCKQTKEGITRINNENMQSKNIIVEGDDCIQIETLVDKNMIVIHDRCKPCCENCEGRTTQVSIDNDIAAMDLISLELRIEALE